MLNKRKILILAMIQYLVVLFVHCFIAYSSRTEGCAVRVLLYSIFCYSYALGAVWSQKKISVALYHMMASILIATFLIGTDMETLDLAFIICLATELMLALFSKYRKIIVYLVGSDLLLIGTRLFRSKSYGTDMGDAKFVLVYLAYNLAGVIIVFLVYSIEKYVADLEEKTKEAVTASESKGTFLANMSHEIRTPMNAILGFVHLILQEKTSFNVAESARGIQAAGEELLVIINDILDISKIESGKFEIISQNYEIKDLIEEVLSFICLKVEDSSLDFYVNCDPDLPMVLYGDAMRIKQVVMNLLTNAVKFTEKGYIVLSVSVNRNEDDVDLCICVEDTGIGIRSEDLDRLFESFEQVDIHRNRMKEGTGLGLSISKQFVELMNGSISVESEYGKGSKFYVRLPQKISVDKPFVSLKDSHLKVAMYVNQREFLQIAGGALRKFQIPIQFTTSFEGFQKYIRRPDFTHYFVSAECYNENKEYIESIDKNKKVFVIQPRGNTLVLENNMNTVLRPFYAVPFADALNGEINNKRKNDSMEVNSPNITALIVDDNEVNLKVTKGLIKPMFSEITMASSGQQAVEMIQKKRFSIVFMDHMMPGMDGIETTKAIRELDGDYYQQVPIVALTANAVAGAREMFLANGFQDYLSKPMEMRELNRVLKEWLPEGTEFTPSDKLIEERKKAQKDLAWIKEIEDIEFEPAIRYLDQDTELFLEILTELVRSIPTKIKIIEASYKNHDLARYEIEVHAMKSATRSIGAMNISKDFYDMEQAAREKNIAYIDKEYKRTMEKIQTLYEKLIVHLPEAKLEDDSLKPVMKLSSLECILFDLESACRLKDIKSMQTLMNYLGQYRMSQDRLKEHAKKLKQSIAEKDFLAIDYYIQEMIRFLQFTYSR